MREITMLWSPISAGAITSRVAVLSVDPTFTKITQGPIVNDRLDTGWILGGLRQRRSIGSARCGDTGHGGSTTTTVAPCSAPSPTGPWVSINSVMWGVWGDPDNDGDLDMFAYSDRGSPLYMFWNDGSGNFTRLPVDGLPGANVGGAWGDYRQRRIPRRLLRVDGSRGWLATSQQRGQYIHHGDQQ